MNKIKFKDTIDNETFTPMVIMEVPLSKEMLQDCFLYNSMDAPSEIKRMVLELVSESFENYILEGAPNHVNKELIQKKFDNVKIKLEEC